MVYSFLLIGLIIFFAAFVQSFSGFGFALISIPLLTFFFDIKTAVPLGALFGLIINILLVIKLKEEINFKKIKNLYIGALFGIPLGIWVFVFVNASILKYAVAIIIIVFVFNAFIKILKPQKLNPFWGYITGLISGILGGALNINGPPVLIYFYFVSSNKTELKSSISGYFIVTSIIIVTTHLISGITSTFIILNFLYFLPFLFLGFYLGISLFNKVKTEIFNKIVLFILMIIATLLFFN
ncbi:MAG: sulfite exporter TauE/SafE family protein [bacterium]